MPLTEQDETRMSAAAFEWLQVLAMLGGKTHDLGKAGNYFVEKLQQAVKGEVATPDPARHEWISMKVLEQMLQGKGFHDAFSHMSVALIADTPQLRQGVQRAADTLLYLCATHHRLFGPAFSPTSRSLAKLDSSRHVRQPLRPFVYPVDEHRVLSQAWIDDVTQALQCLTQRAADGEQNEPFWYGLAWQARVALILADYGVSAMKRGQPDPQTGQPSAIPPQTPGLYANTWPQQATPKARGYNQPLEMHLNAVADQATEVAQAMWQMVLPSLNESQVRNILDPVADAHQSPFSWQDQAVESIRQCRKTSNAPMLVLNVASTGSGKTVMNMKAACAAATNAVRVSYALNLRTLTLQTGDAVKRDLSLNDQDVATIIGDEVIAYLHDVESNAADAQEAQVDSAEGHAADTSPPDIYESVRFQVMGGRQDLPDWLSPITDKRPEWRRILASPVLVSTVDFLVHAGEPGHQGHHAAAYLRLMHSDLVLDEVDSYDLESLVAVLRLVHVAASLGRNVVCSSATLPRTIASAIAEAYESGYQIWSALSAQTSAHHLLVVSDSLAPKWVSSGRQFEQDYQNFLQSLMCQSMPITKRVALQPVQWGSGMTGLLASIEAGVSSLHRHHRWALADTGKKVSFGLVRVANIQVANQVAAHLQQQPGTYVCLYHARDFMIQRHMKEQQLDKLLTRKRGNTAIEQDQTIRALCTQENESSLRFVVVATPVEEIGRDHDFDWAVIEPSSSHSIVQTAGRVNRHRREAVSAPNILILQYSARALRGEAVVFTRPGPEGSLILKEHLEQPDIYPDLAQLFDWHQLDQLTAAMAFDDRHPMVKAEQQIQQKLLKQPLQVLWRAKPYESIWMTRLFYDKYPLRGGSSHDLEEWRVIPDERGLAVWQQRVKVGFDVKYQDKPAPQTDMPSTNWLSWDLDALWSACENVNLSMEEGMAITIRRSH